MDVELIIYLIFLAIVFVARLLKKSSDKSKAPTPSGQGGGQARPQSRPRPKTFEELLEEFTSQQEDTEEEATMDSGRSSMEELEPEPNSWKGYEKESAPDYSSPYETYQGSGSKLKTLDEMVDIDKVRTRTSLIKEEEEEKSEGENGFRELLRDPEDARKAIILSEIIRRRY